MLLSRAVQEFLEAKENQYLSEQTLYTYRSILSQFVQFCEEQGVVLLQDVIPDIPKFYISFCKKERKNNPVSINSKIKNLRSFFNFLVSEGFLEESPIKNLKFVKTDTRIETFTEGQVKQIFAYLKKRKNQEGGFHEHRDLAVVTFLLGTGARAGEMCTLTWDDVDFNNSYLVLFGKSREAGAVPIVPRLKKELIEYQAFCARKFIRLPVHVFTNQWGAPMTRSSVLQMFKRLNQYLGIRNVRFSPHTFRHTFAQDYIAKGGDLYSLQKMLRHSRSSTTEKYMAMWGTALASQNNKFNPLNHL